jgi:hypothetical protein
LARSWLLRLPLGEEGRADLVLADVRALRRRHHAVGDGVDPAALVRRRVEVVEHVVHAVPHERGHLGGIPRVGAAAPAAEAGQRHEPERQRDRHPCAN